MARTIDPTHETIGSDILAILHALRHPEPIIERARPRS